MLFVKTRLMKYWEGRPYNLSILSILYLTHSNKNWQIRDRQILDSFKFSLRTLLPPCLKRPKNLSMWWKQQVANFVGYQPVNLILALFDMAILCELPLCKISEKTGNHSGAPCLHIWIWTLTKAGCYLSRNMARWNHPHRCCFSADVDATTISHREGS